MVEFCIRHYYCYYLPKMRFGWCVFFALYIIIFIIGPLLSGICKRWPEQKAAFLHFLLLLLFNLFSAMWFHCMIASNCIWGSRAVTQKQELKKEETNDDEWSMKNTQNGKTKTEKKFTFCHKDATCGQWWMRFHNFRFSHSHRGFISLKHVSASSHVEWKITENVQLPASHLYLSDELENWSFSQIFCFLESLFQITRMSSKKENRKIVQTKAEYAMCSVETADVGDVDTK